MKKPLKAFSALDRRFEAIVSRHYGCPTGVIGRVAGKRMARQHEVETGWTVSLLALTPTDRVLEIGCGAGRALKLVAQEIPSGQVVGVDLSPTMVREARRCNAQAIRVGTVVVEPGDVTHLPFADAQFDKVFSIHSTYFWPDRARALAELRRVLRPGGVLVRRSRPARTSPPLRVRTGFSRSSTTNCSRRWNRRVLKPSLSHRGRTRVDGGLPPPSA